MSKEPTPSLKQPLFNLEPLPRKRLNCSSEAVVGGSFKTDRNFLSKEEEPLE
jgi:hypothetical protein